MKNTRLFLCALALFLSFSTGAMAAASRSVETQGTLTDAGSGRIADNIWITVVRIDKETVRLGFTAPLDIKILREELLSESEQWKESKEPSSYPMERRHS